MAESNDADGEISQRLPEWIGILRHIQRELERERMRGDSKSSREMAQGERRV